MRNIARNKWQIPVAVLVIFALGFIAGALSLNLYHSRHRAAREAEINNRIERNIEQLNLSPDQKVRVKIILDDTREQLRDIRNESQPKVNDLRKQARERLQAVLTAEQWQQLQDKMKDTR